MEGPRRLDRSSRELVFEDTFPGPELDPGHWIAAYLPQWSTPELSAARCDLVDGGLRLRIDADQPPWCPGLDGDTRVSSIQTGAASGPAGSAIGQHRFRESARVRTAQPRTHLYTPTYGLIEVRASAVMDPDVMVALWMIGVEDRPEESGEICVAELFGRDISPTRALVGMGVHPHHDPRIVDAFEAMSLPMDAREPHTYSVDWAPGRVDWYVDDRWIRAVDQSPDYPMQLMLGIYEFPSGGMDTRPEARYPKVFVVEWLRGYR